MRESAGSLTSAWAPLPNATTRHQYFFPLTRPEIIHFMEVFQHVLKNKSHLRQPSFLLSYETV